VGNAAPKPETLQQHVATAIAIVSNTRVLQESFIMFGTQLF
jgi:hypothetical protein